MVDDVIIFMGHILVDIDISPPLPGDVVLMVGDRPWTQPLDFEGLPFRCKKCFATSHSTSNCSLLHHKGVATWWKDATLDHLTIYAIDSADELLSVDDVVVDATVVCEDSILVAPDLDATPGDSLQLVGSLYTYCFSS